MVVERLKAQGVFGGPFPKDGARGVGPFGGVVSQLPPSGVVHRAPGHRRPHVVHRPVEGSIVFAQAGAVTLQSLPQAFGLGHLTLDNPSFQAVLHRCTRGGRHVVSHHVPPVKPRLEPIHLAPLAELQGFVLERVDARLLECRHVRQALESVFARKPTFMAAVVVPRLPPKPNAPRVGISCVFLQGGGGGVVERSAVFVHHVGQQPVKHGRCRLGHTHTVLSVQVVHLLPAPGFPGFGHLVVPTPQGETRMVPQALHLRRRLGRHIVLKGRIVGHHGAREHEVLPNQDALVVARLEESVGRVHAAAPNPKHVHVGVHGVLNHVEPWGCVGEVVKVWRHHVCAA